MSLASGDLTTYQNAINYVAQFNGLTLPNSLVSGLVTRISRLIETKINRSILVPSQHNQVFNGTGTTSLVLPDWPVLSISNFTINGVSIPVAPQATGQMTVSIPYGYRVPPWGGRPPGNPGVIELVGGAYFFPGNQNVVVSYTAGYQVTDEAVNMASSTNYTPLQPYGIWATDRGVTYETSGATLQPTTGNPSAGFYVAPDPDATQSTTATSFYVFNTADISTGIQVTYGYIPYDLEQACLEWIADRASYRSRVGVRSQSLAAQESMTYDMSGVPPAVAAMIMPYVSVLPPALGGSV